MILGRWERWKAGQVEGGSFLVLFKVGGCRVSTRHHLFVFGVNQGNKEAG